MYSLFKKDGEEQKKIMTAAYTCLVLSGGGLKGLSMLGALQYFADRGKLSHLNKVIGTSIGAILGYLIIIGYSPVEIMLTLHQSRIIERLGKAFSMFDMMRTGGAVCFTLLQKLLEDMTIHKVGHLLTLGQLFDEFGKHLVCCTYNYTKHTTEYLDATSCPHLPCITALHMSSCLPCLFSPFLYENMYYLDGALIDHFPIQCSAHNDIVLGIYLKTQHAPPLNPKMKKEFSFLSYVFDVLSIPLHFHAREHMNKSWPFTCDILDIEVGLPVFQLDVSLHLKFETFSKGYAMAKHRFQSHSITPYVSPSYTPSRTDDGDGDERHRAEDAQTKNPDEPSPRTL